MMVSKPTSRVEKTPRGLAFYGSIDHQTVPQLIRALPDIDGDDVELDLSGADKIDSAGLAMLLSWGTHNLPADHKIRLRGTSTRLKHLIEIMHLDSMFELLPEQC